MTEFQEKLLKKLDLLADQQNTIINKLDELVLDEADYRLSNIDSHTEQTVRKLKNLNDNFFKAFKYYHQKTENK